MGEKVQGGPLGLGLPVHDWLQRLLLSAKD